MDSFNFVFLDNLSEAFCNVFNDFILIQMNTNAGNSLDLLLSKFDLSHVEDVVFPHAFGSDHFAITFTL